MSSLRRGWISSRRVVEKLGIAMRPEDLAAATSASVRPDTVLIAVRVKSSSSAEAKVLADAVTAELANDIRKLETPSGSLIPVVDPVVTQLAETPMKPAEPNIAIYLVFGASGGFLVGVTAALWLGRRRAVEGSQVERLTGRPVLGAVGSSHVDSDGIADGGSAAELLEDQWSVIQRNVAFEMGDASAGSSGDQRKRFRPKSQRRLRISLRHSRVQVHASHWS